MGKKLRQSRGESIAETLVALLIAAVALVMLASMITSSTRLIERSENDLNAYYTANNALSAQSGTGTAGTVSITDSADNAVKLSDSDDGTVDVYYYINDKVGSGDVVSYRLTGE